MMQHQHYCQECGDYWQHDDPECDPPSATWAVSMPMAGDASCPEHELGGFENEVPPCA